MKVFVPESMEGVWDVLDKEPHSSFYAGGTDLLVRVRAGSLRPPALICLDRITELRGIREMDGQVFIGACTTHTTLLENPLVARSFPVLHRALRSLGSPQIRNMGTIGGNICTASPGGDTLPPLYALDAEVETYSRRGARRLPIGRFITGPGSTVLEPDEVLYGVRVKKPVASAIHYFEKVGQRKAVSIAIASLAVVLEPDRRGIVQKARLAWGSVGPTVVTSRETEGLLEGRLLSVDALREAMSSIRSTVSPIDDIRASAGYRKTVAANLLLRLLLHVPHEDGRTRS